MSVPIITVAVATWSGVSPTKSAMTEMSAPLKSEMMNPFNPPGILSNAQSISLSTSPMANAHAASTALPPNISVKEAELAAAMSTMSHVG